MGLKGLLKKKYVAYQKERKEDKAYNKILSKKVKLARRQGYADEAVKAAKEKARTQAKARYNPQPQQQSMGNAWDQFAGQAPTVKARTKKKLSTKVRKTSNRQATSLRRRSRQRARQNNDFMEQVWKM